MKIEAVVMSIVLTLGLSTAAFAEAPLNRPPARLSATDRNFWDVVRDSFQSVVKNAYVLAHPELNELKTYGDAWNSGDIDGIVDHFSDAGFIYTDGLSQKGITDKEVLRSYLKRVFSKYPKQNWTQNLQLYKNPAAAREWAIYYHYSLYANVADTVPTITGTGMERYQFDSNGKMTRNEIHMNFDQIDLSKTLGIPDSVN